MPTVVKLSPSEVADLARRGSRVDLTEYLAMLKPFKVGDWGRVELAEGENQRTVKRRLTLAAKQVGFSLRYRPLRDGDPVVFHVLGPQP